MNTLLIHGMICTALSPVLASSSELLSTNSWQFPVPTFSFFSIHTSRFMYNSKIIRPIQGLHLAFLLDLYYFLKTIRRLFYYTTSERWKPHTTRFHSYEHRGPEIAANTKVMTAIPHTYTHTHTGIHFR